MKSWPNVATKQLQSCKKVQQKSRDVACKAKFFPSYLRQVAKVYVATSHNVVWLETIEISKQRTAFIRCFAQEVDWCLKDCDKQRLQSNVSRNLWKIFAGHTGDWFDVRTASICTTDLLGALKSFILNSLKFKVAPYPIIVSLDTLRCPETLFISHENANFPFSVFRVVQSEAKTPKMPFTLPFALYNFYMP